MKCNEALEQMNALLDGELSEKDIQTIEEHLASCESCTVAYEEYKAIMSAMEEMPMLALPIGFEDELHFKLMQAKNDMVEEKQVPEKTSVWQKIKEAVFNRSFVAGAGTVVAMGLVVILAQNAPLATKSFEETVGIEGTAYDTAAPSEAKMDVGDLNLTSQNASEADDMEMEMAKEAPAPAAEANNIRTTDQSLYREDRMVIKNASISVQVEGFDESREAIVSKVESLGGYVENANVWVNYTYNGKDYRLGSFTLRVPTDQYNDVLSGLKGLGKVQSENVSATDVTKQYRDTASTIENLKISEQRLQELLKAATQVPDLLAIENELTRIRNDINLYTEQIKTWEHLVDLSTISVELIEVETLDPKIEPIDNTLWSRAYAGLIQTLNGIKGFFEELVVKVVAYFPVWIIGLPVGFIFIRKIVKNIKKRKQ